MGRTYWAVVSKAGMPLMVDTEADSSPLAVYSKQAHALSFWYRTRLDEHGPFRVVKVRVEIVEESDAG